MQTSFTPEFIKTQDGNRVDSILRKCVHCGFCNATCPTYQLTGNELDGPRGRIYLIKNYFESQTNETANQAENQVSLKHLDRCLTCMSCETTCPSGVNYGELVDLGRKHIQSSEKRPFLNTLKRKAILFVFSNASRTKLLFSFARIAKPFLPNTLAKKIPGKLKSHHPQDFEKPTKPVVDKKMLTIKGCVQSCVAPEINQATQIALNRSGIQLDETAASCCGALAFHLTELEQAHETIRSNINDWYEKLQNGYDNILINSSGCSTFIKQYATIMQDDSEYADKAKLVVDRCLDASELAPSINAASSHSTSDNKNQTVAFHSPCTLQHGQKIKGVIENKLREAGYSLVDVQDSHICCGSAGSYSLLQKDLSAQLLNNKISALESDQPDLIVTANIGCLMHLQSGTDIPVKHWIELLA